MAVTFNLNGVNHTVEDHPGMTLFDHLRNTEFFSVKEGCDHGECGACTVLIDDASYNACLILVQTLEGKSVETLEGLNSKQSIVQLQEAFIAKGAIQCGYCSPGMLVSLEALDRESDLIEEQDIREALAGNLCRCTGYVKPVEAAEEVYVGKQGK